MHCATTRETHQVVFPLWRPTNAPTYCAFNRNRLWPATVPTSVRSIISMETSDRCVCHGNKSKPKSWAMAVINGPSVGRASFRGVPIRGATPTVTMTVLAERASVRAKSGHAGGMNGTCTLGEIRHPTPRDRQRLKVAANDREQRHVSGMVRFHRIPNMATTCHVDIAWPPDNAVCGIPVCSGHAYPECARGLQPL